MHLGICKINVNLPFALILENIWAGRHFRIQINRGEANAGEYLTQKIEMCDDKKTTKNHVPFVLKEWEGQNIPPQSMPLNVSFLSPLK